MHKFCMVGYQNHMKYNIQQQNVINNTKHKPDFNNLPPTDKYFFLFSYETQKQ